MPIAVACPHCNVLLNAPDAAVGKLLTCPKCKATIQVSFQVHASVSFAPPQEHATVVAGNGEPSGSNHLWLYLGLGGAVLVIAIVVVVLLVVSNAKNGVWKTEEDHANADRTKATIDALTTICNQFHEKYGRWPESLDELITPPDGGAPYVKTARVFRDGWRQPLQYDPTGRKFNNGTQPDIWCERDGKILSNGPD